MTTIVDATGLTVAFGTTGMVLASSDTHKTYALQSGNFFATLRWVILASDGLTWIGLDTQFSSDF